MRDRDDLQSGRMSDVREELKEIKEKKIQYQEENQKLSKEISQLKSQLQEEDFLHKRLSEFQIMTSQMKYVFNPT